MSSEADVISSGLKNANSRINSQVTIHEIIHK